MTAATLILLAIFLVVLLLAAALAYIVLRDRQADVTSLSRQPISADLVQLNGPGIGMRHPLRAAETVIGSEQSCDVVISGTGVSPQHAAVRAESGRYVLLDRKSQNGIWASGRRVFAAGLQPGSQFQIGLTVFALVRQGDPAPAPINHLDRRTNTPTRTESFAIKGVGFEQLEQIGFGGQVTVYKARAKADGSVLAVKYLNEMPREDGRAYFRQKFKQQIIVGMSLRHPHCVRILGGDPLSEPPYLVEEYVPGGTLKDRMDRGRLPYEESVRIIGEVCDALHYMHRKNLVHRDIKPGNILLDAAGAIKLTDFGLIRIAGAPRVTQIGMCLGTPHYMSVEQVRGDSSRVGPRSDLYSLGIVAFELFTGRLPFDGNNEAILTMHLSARPAMANEIDPRVPERIVRAIARALEKDPARRFADAREMAQAFGYDKAFERGQVTEHSSAPAAPLRLKDDASGKTVVIQSSPTVLTRALINPLDKLISREHGYAYVLDGLWRIAEQAHKPTVNGLFVNGVRVDEEGDIVQPGDELRLGHTTLRVVA